MIDGVGVYPLKKVSDSRGAVMHMLKKSDAHFKEFGEIYFSSINPGAVKGWNRHKKMILNLTAASGNIKMVLFDQRDGSPTHGELQEITIGEDNYCLVQVPPMIWVGFQCVGQKAALLANCATLVHDPDEIERLDPDTTKIPYQWKKASG